MNWKLIESASTVASNMLKNMVEHNIELNLFTWNFVFPNTAFGTQVEVKAYVFQDSNSGNWVAFANGHWTKGNSTDFHIFDGFHGKRWNRCGFPEGTL